MMHYLTRIRVILQLRLTWNGVPQGQCGSSRVRYASNRINPTRKHCHHSQWRNIIQHRSTEDTKKNNFCAHANSTNGWWTNARASSYHRYRYETLSFYMLCYFRCLFRTTIDGTHSQTKKKRKQQGYSIIVVMAQNKNKKKMLRRKICLHIIFFCWFVVLSFIGKMTRYVEKWIKIIVRHIFSWPSKKQIIYFSEFCNDLLNNLFLATPIIDGFIAVCNWIECLFDFFSNLEDHVEPVDTLYVFINNRLIMRRIDWPQLDSMLALMKHNSNT